MAVRTDKVQLNIEFITDEARNLAKANTDIKALTKELKQTVRNGGDVADVMRRIAEAGGKVEDLDLSKVAPQQLVTRARQLKQVLDQIPSSAPGAAKLRAEYKRINDRLATMRKETRGVAALMGEGKGGLTATLKSGYVAALAFIAGFAGVVRGMIRATSLTQTYGKVLERELGGRSEAQKAIKDITKLADDLGKPADQLLGSYTKLVSRGLRPTTEELVKIVDLAASQGKEVDQLTEALLDAATLEFERLKEFGIKAKQSGDQVALSFKGQTIEVAKTQKAILDAVIGFGALDGVQGAAADSADNLGGKVERLTGFFDRLLANIGQGGLGQSIGALVDNASDLLKIFVDLTDVQSSLTTEVRGTQAAFNLEIETLKRGSISTETRNQLIDSINTKYGEYLPNLLTEESTLGDIAEAQEKANRQFEQRIILLAAEEQLQDVAAKRLAAKSEELELELKLTEARQRTIDADKRAAQQQNTQSFAGTGAAKGIAGQAAANSLAVQAQERLNENKEEQIRLEEEFQKVLKAGEALGLDIESVLNPRTGGGGGGTGEAKKTLEDAIKELREKFAIIEEISEQAFLRGETNESDYQKSLLELQEKEYEAQLLLFDRFNQSKTSKAEKARTELLRVQQALNRDPGAAVLTIDQARAALGEDPNEIGPVDSDKAEIERAEALAQRLGDIDEELLQRRIDLAERERKVKESLRDAGIAAANESTDAVISLLSKDEEARKKNAKLIKAIQISQTIANGFAELSAIRLATAKEAASVALIPGAAALVKLKGVLEAVAVIARTSATVGSLKAQTFARGGRPKFGQFGGRSHAAGGTRGVFDDGTQIEVERDETFAIVNKNAHGLLGFLSQVNQETGGVAFARGGLALNAPNTTPVVSSATLATSAAPAADQSELLARIDTLTAVTASMQTRLKAEVVYTEIESVADDVSTVRAAAEV